MTAPWTPRSVPPQRGTLVSLSEAARASAEEFGSLGEVQRHVLRALREPASFVAVAPIGAGKWTACLLGLASYVGPGATHASATWLLGTDEAARFAEDALRSLGAASPVRCARRGAMPAPGTSLIVVGDVHLWEDPVAELAALRAAHPDAAIVATSEPVRDATALAQALGGPGAARPGLVDATPWATTRWRLIAPWRDAIAAPSEDATVAELQRTARDWSVSRFLAPGREASLAWATRLLDTPDLDADDASVQPESDGWWSVRIWNRTPVAPVQAVGRDGEVVFLTPCWDGLLVAREGTASGPFDVGRGGAAVVCGDAVDILLVATQLEALRGGRALTPGQLVEEASRWAEQVTAVSPDRAVYAAVAGLRTNRGNASSWVAWARAAGAEAGAQLRVRCGLG